MRGSSARPCVSGMDAACRGERDDRRRVAGRVPQTRGRERGRERRSDGACLERANERASARSAATSRQKKSTPLAHGARTVSPPAGRDRALSVIGSWRAPGRGPRRPEEARSRGHRRSVRLCVLGVSISLGLGAGARAGRVVSAIGRERVYGGGWQEGWLLIKSCSRMRVCFSSSSLFPRASALRDAPRRGRR